MFFFSVDVENRDELQAAHVTERFVNRNFIFVVQSWMVPLDAACHGSVVRVKGFRPSGVFSGSGATSVA